MAKSKKLAGFTEAQQALITLYVDKVVQQKRHLSRVDLAKLGYSRDKIRALFESLTNLRETCVTLYPKELAGFDVDKIFAPKRMVELKGKMKEHKTFVISFVANAAPVHQDFYESIQTYCKKNNAMLLLLPDPNLEVVDPSIVNESFVFQDLRLNSNIHISSIKIPAKNINPCTSLNRMGQRNGSVIVGSPKQFLESVATSNTKLPHLLNSTGAITKAKYVSVGGAVRRLDTIAAHDHTLGALIVEVVDNKKFHIRQIQAEDSGRFADNGTYYYGKKTCKVIPKIVVGDYHVTETCPIAEKALEEQVDFYGAEELIFHDFFSGVSVNHHEMGQYITRAKLYAQGHLSLITELRACAEFLNKWTSKKKNKRIAMVDSNHHDFLTKHYLQKALYALDPQNHEVGAQMAVAMLQGHNPLRWALENLCGLKHPEKILWLERDVDYKYGGVELGAHGDKGANGSRGSPNTIEHAYGQVMVGHSHSPRIMRGFWQVGTLSRLKLNYNVGPSSWMNTNGLVYPNGGRQIINTVFGEWKMNS